MLIILTRKRNETFDLLRKALRMRKLELVASLKSYCQSPVNLLSISCQSPVSSILASLKRCEQDVSLPEVSNQLLDEL